MYLSIYLYQIVFSTIHLKKFCNNCDTPDHKNGIPKSIIFSPNTTQNRISALSICVLQPICLVTTTTVGGSVTGYKSECSVLDTCNVQCSGDECTDCIGLDDPDVAQCVLGRCYKH